jgi:hypothetical protein
MSKLEKDETPVPPNMERDSANPTVQQMFVQEKLWLLDNINLLLRLVSDAAP